MNNNDKTKYLDRYNHRLSKFGYDIRTLGWGGDKNRQFLRFKIALELEHYVKRNIKSVLDIGCGFGDFGDYLSKKYPDITYKGLEINPQLVTVAHSIFPTLDISVGDVLDMNLPKYDLVTSSGIFNYILENQDNITYIDTMIRKFYHLSNLGVSVDFMSSYVDFKHPNAFHLEESHAINIAKKNSKRCVLRNDYLDFEYCLYILKESLL